MTSAGLVGAVALDVLDSVVTLGEATGRGLMDHTGRGVSVWQVLTRLSRRGLIERGTAPGAWRATARGLEVHADPSGGPSGAWRGPRMAPDGPSVLGCVGRAILLALLDGPGTVAAVSAGMDRREASVRQAMANLDRAGFLDRDYRSRPYLWTVSEAGREALRVRTGADGQVRGRR